MAIRSSKRIVVADAHTKTGKKASACEHREGRKVLFPHRPPARPVFPKLGFYRTPALPFHKLAGPPTGLARVMRVIKVAKCKSGSFPWN